jgi:peptidoglycan-N-acetylglucosamine deacetylase
MSNKRHAYLTIDDSPTRHTDQLTDFLLRENIPAVLYCIGGNYTDLHLHCEGIEQNPKPILNAIHKGFVIANHTYTHRRSSELSYDDVIDEIEKTENLIDGLYKQSGKARPAKLIRFPHLDRGCGGWVVDYDAAGPHRDALLQLFTGGLNITLQPPSPGQIEKKAKIQHYLKQEGFTADVFTGITLPWYTDTEMAQARDSLMTFSSSDWMLNPDFKPHAASWPYKTLDALKKKIDADPYLQQTGTRHIVLCHDHNNLFETTCALITHLQQNNFGFEGITP